MDDFMINRVDQEGRSIYLSDRPAHTHAVVFTGAPGMGKSYLLHQTAEQARDDGRLVIKVDASSREPLQNRMTRAIGDQLDQLREQTPFSARGLLRRLRTTLDTMLTNRFDVQHAISGSLTWWAPLRIAFSHGRDQQFERPTSSMNDLADRLADLAEDRDQQVVLLIDNLDRAQEADLATINELTAHLQQHGRPVQLVMGASQPALDNLLAAASPDGVPSDAARNYDVRICGPIPDEELRPALTSRVARADSAITADAADRLVAESSGDPGRLFRLADRAIELADRSSGISTDTAGEAISRLRTSDSWLYHASWANLTGTAKAILADAAASPEGSKFADLNQGLDPAEWAERDAAREELVGAGLTRETDGRLIVANPGMREWVTDHSGSRPELQSAGEQAAGTAVQKEKTTSEKTATATNKASERTTRTKKTPQTKKTPAAKKSSPVKKAGKASAKTAVRKSSSSRPSTKRAGSKTERRPTRTTPSNTGSTPTTRTTAKKVRPPDLQTDQPPIMRSAARRQTQREFSRTDGRTS